MSGAAKYGLLRVLAFAGFGIIASIPPRRSNGEEMVDVVSYFHGAAIVEPAWRERPSRSTPGRRSRAK